MIARAERITRPVPVIPKPQGAREADIAQGAHRRPDPLCAQVAIKKDSQSLSPHSVYYAVWKSAHPRN